EADLGRTEEDRMAAQLAHADLEGRARAQTRLLEDQRQPFAREQPVRDPAFLFALEIGGESEQAVKFAPAEAVKIQQIALTHGRCARNGLLAGQNIFENRRPRSISRLVIVSGGAKRKTLVAVQLSSRPSPMQASAILLPSTVSSTPIKSPLPRISRINEKRFFNASSPLTKYLPICTQFFSTPPLTSAFITASPAAQETGLPPKVDAWLPGMKLAATSSRASMAPSGKPPPSALARVMMSGLTPKCS